jgi:hypothetical protein
LSARRFNIRKNEPKNSRWKSQGDARLNVNRHTTAARRTDLARRDANSGQAIYALQTDLDQRSST